MKQSLQLRLGQQLTMTPQLQQAIRLLQLSSIELKQQIQETLESNIMLEQVDEGEGQEAGPGEAEPPSPLDSPPETGGDELPVDTVSENIPEELPLDIDWGDIYDNVHATLPADEADKDFLFQRGAPEGLHEHLAWQMELSRFSERDAVIAAAILDAINADGYLEASPDEIHRDLSRQLPDLEPEEIQAVLHRIQHFDPPGVAATSLGECLAIQLRQLPEETRWRREAMEIVTGHLEDLGRHDAEAIKKALELDDAALEEAIALIRTLNPHPGSAFAPGGVEYVIPDVFVFRHNGRWAVSLNPEVAPRLRINPYYLGMIKRADRSADNLSMRTHLKEARWFLRSLQSRSETLLRVAQCIVEKQQEFFEHGEVAMKAMILRDVAEELSMHESTVSRVTTNKYMHTPRGIYEFKYFFSSCLTTQSGGECSATAAKAFILELIQQENPAKPLSDLKIARLLQDQGINVARRTVAKYREAMHIPSSSQRKRLL